jgi:hypothetical protein
MGIELLKSLERKEAGKKEIAEEQGRFAKDELRRKKMKQRSKENSPRVQFYIIIAKPPPPPPCPPALIGEANMPTPIP